MKKGMVILDTLIINVRYPTKDIFLYWNEYVEGVDKHKLERGIPVENFVAKTGGVGYKFSLWQHDARIFLTDQTDEIRGEGKGMGIRIQLGPKFIIHHINDLVSGIEDLLAQLGIRNKWPIRVSRIDLAVDLFNTAIREQTEEEWKNNWVGRSKISRCFYNSKNSEIETITVGSRQSSIYLRNYNKIAESVKDGDIVYWLDVWKEENLQEVTRVEWEIKTKRANLPEDLTDFYRFNKISRTELLNYLVQWGRLTIPSSDVNRSRWESAPYWKQVEEIIQEWAEGINWPTSRYGKEFKGISEAYIDQLSGMISGGLARLGGEDLNLMTMFEEMAIFGEGLDEIHRKAKEKAIVYRRI